MTIKEAISKVVQGKDLTKDETYFVINNIMNGEATSAQIGSFLTALKLKGETIEEVSGAAQAMVSNAEPFNVQYDDVVDTCGTGGDELNTFNISTTAALLAAGVGVKIAKHGNHSVSSHCGSADILKSFGVNIELDVENSLKIFEETGITFLFAPLYHKAMKYAVGPRREMGIRTIFNILGPLTNPARTKRQVIGVFDKSFCDILAHVMKNMGAEHVMVVHGEDGLDEISISGETYISELRNGEVQSYTIHPENYGIQSQPISAIQTTNCDMNKKIIQSVLSGEKDAALDIAVINAAASIVVGGFADNLLDATEMAYDSAMSGKAKDKLKLLVEKSNA